MKTKEKKKKKLLPLGDHWIPGVTERPKPTKKDDYVNKILKGSG